MSLAALPVAFGPSLRKGDRVGITGLADSGCTGCDGVYDVRAVEDAELRLQKVWGEAPSAEWQATNASVLIDNIAGTKEKAGYTANEVEELHEGRSRSARRGRRGR